MKRAIIAAVIVLLALAIPALGYYTDGQSACYEVGVDASGIENPSVVYFDGELPGCDGGIPVLVGVPNVNGELVTGPWLSWSE